MNAFYFASSLLILISCATASDESDDDRLFQDLRDHGKTPIKHSPPTPPENGRPKRPRIEKDTEKSPTFKILFIPEEDDSSCEPEIAALTLLSLKSAPTSPLPKKGADDVKERMDALIAETVWDFFRGDGSIIQRTLGLPQSHQSHSPAPPE